MMNLSEIILGIFGTMVLIISLVAGLFLMAAILYVAISIFIAIFMVLWPVFVICIVIWAIAVFISNA